jgi:NADPH:quinone reductase-like Zn-dependent oxidoreductase
MKAIIYAEYGPPEVVRLVEVERPVPEDDEVLIRVRAASINAFDCHLLRGEPRMVRLALGFRRPKDSRLGVDVAGQVEAVGTKVTQLKPGDEVFGACRGSFAEYACAKESRVVIKHQAVSFEQAASLPIAASTALQGLRNKGKVQPGQKVLINGAGGGVGTFAVQIAKLFGAEVTAVTSTGKLDMVRAIGADHVIDYTREDFTRNAQRYDVIFDLGVTHPLPDMKRALTAKGKWLFVGGTSERGWVRPFAELAKGMAQSPFMSQKVVVVPARANREDLMILQQYIEDGQVTPVIARICALSEVPAAMRYVEDGHAGGKVVITVSESGTAASDRRNNPHEP